MKGVKVDLHVDPAIAPVAQAHRRIGKRLNVGTRSAGEIFQETTSKEITPDSGMHQHQ